MLFYALLSVSPRHQVAPIIDIKFHIADFLVLSLLAHTCNFLDTMYGCGKLVQ